MILDFKAIIFYLSFLKLTLQVLNTRNALNYPTSSLTCNFPSIISIVLNVKTRCLAGQILFSQETTATLGRCLRITESSPRSETRSHSRKNSTATLFATRSLITSCERVARSISFRHYLAIAVST